MSPAAGSNDSPSTASSVRAAAQQQPQPSPPHQSGSFGRGAPLDSEPSAVEPEGGGSLRGRFSSDLATTSQRVNSAASTSSAGGGGASHAAPSPGAKAGEAAAKPPVGPSRQTSSTGALSNPKASDAAADGSEHGSFAPASSFHGVPATPAVSGFHHSHSASATSLNGSEITPMPGTEAGVARSSKMSAIRRVESFIPPELVEVRSGASASQRPERLHHFMPCSPTQEPGRSRRAEGVPPPTHTSLSLRAPFAPQYQQLAKTGVAAGLPSGIRPPDTGLRGANSDADGSFAQALNRAAEMGDEEDRGEEGDQGDSVDYCQFDVSALSIPCHPPCPHIIEQRGLATLVD